jgi:hypothetical protein
LLAADGHHVLWEQPDAACLAATVGTAFPTATADDTNTQNTLELDPTRWRGGANFAAGTNRKRVN